MASTLLFSHYISFHFSSLTLFFFSIRAVDLSTGIPDYEVPNKSQSHSAPRALAVDTYHSHLAVGDRSGRLIVFDLKDMTEICKCQAHSAEILTLHYSPPMRLNNEGVWSVDIDSRSNESGDDVLVLLASAGRDRLMHVFDASCRYVPLKTLDNHSSSVTSVKFTYDGQKVISCGGDRTLVFCSVNGPDITRVKSVQVRLLNVSHVSDARHRINLLLRCSSHFRCEAETGVPLDSSRYNQWTGIRNEQ